MGSDWKQGLDAVRADEALKQRTREFVRRQRGRAAALRRTAYAACACLALCCVLAAGYWLYFVPTALISVDINPSLELSVNRLGRVIRVEGYNEDGQQLADSLDLVHKRYTQAVEQLLNSDTVQSCLARDEFLSLGVVEIDPQQGQTILQYLNSCTAGQANARCYALTPQQADEAHALGLSCGKYRAYQEVLACTDAYSPQEIGAMTMRQIRDLLAQLQAEDSPAAGAGNGQGNGQGNGHRYGRS